MSIFSRRVKKKLLCVGMNLVVQVAATKVGGILFEATPRPVLNAATGVESAAERKPAGITHHRTSGQQHPRQHRQETRQGSLRLGARVRQACPGLDR
jgi:hypothetical protein